MLRKAPRFAPRSLSLHAVVLGSFALQMSPTIASARQVQTALSQPTEKVYNLPSNQLRDTLDAISVVSGRSIVYDAAAIGGLQAAPVAGSLTARTALEQALSGTGLVIEERGDDSLEVKAMSVQVTAKRDEAETSFKADRSNTATRGGGYLQDVPASVTLITAKVLETQQVTSLVDALRNVSGVSTSVSPQATTSYMIRGFSASATSNGVADAAAARFSVFGVERIEVLKGPQAILSGGDSLGGGVNIVTKKPQSATLRDLTVQVGSHADKTIALDLSGALANSQNLSYRLIGAWADASSAAGGYDGRNNKSLMPSIRWKSEATDFVVGAAYTKEHEPTPQYTFARRDGQILAVPSIRLANRRDGFDTMNKSLYYSLEHQIAPSLLLVSRMRRTLDQVEIHLPSPPGLIYSDDTAPYVPDPVMPFYVSRAVQKERTTSGDHYLRTSFATREIQHKLSAGYSHSSSRKNYLNYEGEPLDVAIYPAVSTEFPMVRSRATSLSAFGASAVDQKALYVQEMASYGDWNLLINARRTRYHTPAATSTFIRFDEVYVSPAETVTQNTPGLGVIYKVTEKKTQNTSYAEGFAPRVGLSCELVKLPPQQTKNKEIGSKMQLLDGKLSLTASLFSVQLSNQAQYDMLRGCDNIRPGQRTKGVELDAQGQIVAGLDVIFNYTYKKLEDVGDKAAVYPGEPKQKLSFWSNYSFQMPKLKGYGMGLGLTATSGSLGTYDTAYPFTLPGQAQVDASVFYANDKLSVILGVKNLADRTLYSTATSPGFVPVLPGRQFMLTVKRSFN